MSEYRNLNITGVGKETGGRFGKVLIAGAGKITGNVECDEFSVPGSGKIEEGGLIVHGPLSCYGASKVEGTVQTEQMAIYGSFHTESDCEIHGDMEIAGALKVEGTCTVGGLSKVNGTVKTERDFRAKNLQLFGVLKSEAAMRAEDAEIFGVLKVDGDVQAENFHAEGPVTIDGELNADHVELTLSGESAIESIVGGSVKVQKSDGTSRRGMNNTILMHINLGGLFSHDRPHLASELIEADEVDLEYTDCETVRGVNVHIGPECVIDRVEYSGTLTTDPNCTVREKIKI